MKTKLPGNTTRMIICLLGLVPILFNSCKQQPANKNLLLSNASRNNNTWNKQEIDTAISLLRSGDLVVRTGVDISSYMLSQMNQYNKTYSHCGIVIIEHGYPFVYHSIGGEDNPDAFLRRDSAGFFFSPENNMGIGIVRYDLDSNKIDRLRSISRQFYKEKRMFDMNFDLNTDDRLYCAEFAYKVLNKATGDSNYIKPTSIIGYKYVGVDNLFVNPHAHMVWQVKYK